MADLVDQRDDDEADAEAEGKLVRVRADRQQQCPAGDEVLHHAEALEGVHGVTAEVVGDEDEQRLGLQEDHAEGEEKAGEDLRHGVADWSVFWLPYGIGDRRGIH